MSRTVFCAKLQENLEGLDYRPYPGELGQRIYEFISKQAWQSWLAQQTILINEYQLDSLDPEARAYLKQEMEKFLFESSI